MNEDGEEWKNSKQKKDIIAAFLDDESGIQSMSPAQIFDTYADGVGWEKQNTVANIRRLKKQYTNKEGPFSEKETSKGATPEPFKTKTTHISGFWKFIFHVSEDRNQRCRFKTVKSFKPLYVCCILHIILSAVVKTYMHQTC